MPRIDWKGDGPKAAELSVHPGDLSQPKMWQQTDGALFWKISKGRTPMPAYRSRFSEPERWMLVNYMRTLAPRETAGPAAKTTPPESQAASETKKLTGPEVAGAAESGPYVSRQEYQKLKAEHEQLKQELAELKALLGRAPSKGASAGAPAAQPAPAKRRPIISRRSWTRSGKKPENRGSGQRNLC